MSESNLNKQKNTQRRNRFYMLLSIGKKDLAFDEEFYYGVFLPQHGASKKNGKYSASTMTNVQLFSAVSDMERLGFKIKPKGGNSSWRNPRLKLIYAMWNKLAVADAIVDGSEQACKEWGKKHTKKYNLEQATSTELNLVVEMIKQWALRKNITVS